MSKYFRLILLSISFSSFNCLLDPYGLRSTEKKERILRPSISFEIVLPRLTWFKIFI